MLVFGKANAKLIELEKLTGKKLFTFSMLAGISCPYAKDCESRVVEVDGKRRIQDGKHTKWRCFSASQEVLFPSVYNSRKKNRDLLLTCNNDTDTMVALIHSSLPAKAEIIRIHVSADFITRNYFHAWLKVAQLNPHIIFYAYTKSLPFWIALMDKVPANFILTASYGGKRDDLIPKHNLRSATVVKNEAEAEALGLEIDHTDELAFRNGPSFALLVHGPMPEGSEWGKAVKALNGKGSYSRKRKMVTV